MKTNNLKSLIGAAALCATLTVPQLASAAVTAPVGYVKLTFNAESDTPFSLPMNRPMVYSGLASAVSGNVISIANTDFTANEFVYDETNQNENYYVIFKTGALEGRSFDVTVNAAGSVTVNPDHTDDNPNFDIASLGGLASDTFEIRPHWTLNTLLPDGEGFPQGATVFDSSSEIHTRPLDRDGINVGSDKIYRYGTAGGWVDTADLLGLDGIVVGDVILRRNTSFIARNFTDEDVVLNVVGDVPTSDATLAIRDNVIAQDTHVAFTYPIDINLDNTGLGGSSVFTSSSSQFSSDGDLLSLYDPTASGYNQGPSKTYFYVDNFGWVDTSALLNGAVTATDINIEAGSASFIRKAGSADSEMLSHQVDMPYNPLAE